MAIGVLTVGGGIMADQEKKTTDNVLKTAAKAIGAAAGKIAHIAGVEGEAPAAPQTKKSVKPAKFAKKDKHRLPRKEKKLLAKKAQKQVA